MKSIEHPHFFDFHSFTAQKICKGGTRSLLTKEIFPILESLSLAVLKLSKGASREPHWHPNAGEFAYCVKGKAIMTIFSPKAGHDTFTLSEGELAFVPKGYIHHLANIHNGETEFLIAFSHASPEDINLSTAVHAMPTHVLASTFKTNSDFFSKLQKGNADVFITDPIAHDENQHSFVPNRFKINVEKINPQIKTEAGSAKIANFYTFPLIEDLCLFSLRIHQNGIREPHWHPNAHELNYVIKGKAKLTILSPGGNIDTFEVGPGAGSFIPASYLHHIENVSPEELHMAVFFSNQLPSDIGLSGALSAYTDEELGAIFNVPPTYFNEMTRFQEDLLIVKGKE